MENTKSFKNIHKKIYSISHISTNNKDNELHIISSDKNELQKTIRIDFAYMHCINNDCCCKCRGNNNSRRKI